ncbi:hypothetical protein OIU78_023114 [Salix suchowensis]|nr:hypothetical protein OIU78_023114 [Salix suchowensis]
MELPRATSSRPSTYPSSRHPSNDFEPSLNTASPLPAFPQLTDLVTEFCKQRHHIYSLQSQQGTSYMVSF